MAKKKRLLITGAAGTIGTALRTHLRDRYDFRLLCHSTIPEDLDASDELVVSDISNFEAMVEACDGVDAIAHLAIFGRWKGMTRSQLAQLTFDVDMKGTYNIYEAARINKVKTVVYASTNHVTGMNEKKGIKSFPDDPVRPDSVYGAGKAFGEALGRWYVDEYGMRVFCLRIANFNGKDEPGRKYEPGHSRWFSPKDIAQMTWRCIEAENLDWGIFYGISKNGHEKWDLTNAKELIGYEPEDDGATEAFRSMYSK